MESKNPTYEIGVIHERFQLLHNDYMKYILIGKKLCIPLKIETTNPDPSLTKKTEVNPHRNEPFVSPLTYYDGF